MSDMMSDIVQDHRGFCHTFRNEPLHQAFPAELVSQDPDGTRLPNCCLESNSQTPTLTPHTKEFGNVIP